MILCNSVCYQRIWCITSRTFLTTYCMQYSLTVPFLRNIMPFSLLKKEKNTSFKKRNTLNSLNLKKCGVEIHNCALLLHFIALISPDKPNSKQTKEKKQIFFTNNNSEKPIFINVTTFRRQLYLSPFNNYVTVSVEYKCSGLNRA